MELEDTNKEIERIKKEIANHEKQKQMLFDASSGKQTPLTVGLYARLQKIYGITTETLIQGK
jgi:hypothetical protein